MAVIHLVFFFIIISTSTKHKKYITTHAHAFQYTIYVHGCYMERYETRKFKSTCLSLTSIC